GRRSRSVSAPSSVTYTSPCWYGLIVPGSTLIYGSNFCIVTRYPWPSSRQPIEAAARPLPSDDTTPPVTKMYLGVRPSIDLLGSTLAPQAGGAPDPGPRACSLRTIRTAFRWP